MHTLPILPLTQVGTLPWSASARAAPLCRGSMDNLMCLCIWLALLPYIPAKSLGSINLPSSGHGRGSLLGAMLPGLMDIHQSDPLKQELQVSLCAPLSVCALTS